MMLQPCAVRSNACSTHAAFLASSLQHAASQGQKLLSVPQRQGMQPGQEPHRRQQQLQAGTCQSCGKFSQSLALCRVRQLFCV